MSSANPYSSLINNLANVDLKKELESGEIKAAFYLSKASTTPVGWILPEVYDALQTENTKYKGDYGGNEPYAFENAKAGGFNRVFFSDAFKTRDNRSEVLLTTTRRWRELALKDEKGYTVFKDALKTPKFGKELFAVHEDPNKDLRGGDYANIACNLPAHAACLFGFIHYGVHLTICYKKDSKWYIWLQKRSSKASYPNCFDNVAAGGLASGENPDEAMARETIEEANIDIGIKKGGKFSDFIPGVEFIGRLRYVFRPANKKWLQPETKYCYVYVLPKGQEIQPAAGDTAVESFHSLTKEEVLASLRESRRDWKPNSALTEAFSLIYTKQWPTDAAGEQFKNVFESFSKRAYHYDSVVKQ